MGVNQELNALQKEVTRQRILETGFRIFAERSIDKVTMNDVADEAKIGVATVYRYFSNKTQLVEAISAWVWEQYVSQTIKKEVVSGETAAERFEYYLNSFLDLYRNHKDLLRFNQFYNVYIGQEPARKGAVNPYEPVMNVITGQFETMRALSLSDKTLRTDLPVGNILFPSMHLMLAAVTRYAVGLVYEGNQDPEKELILLKNMLLKEYTNRQHVL